MKTPKKSEAIKETGFNHNQIHQFEQMAEYPNLVERAKTEAREDDEPVTRSRVLNFIRDKKESEKNIIDVKPVIIDNAPESERLPKEAVDEFEIYKEISDCLDSNNLRLRFVLKYELVRPLR